MANWTSFDLKSLLPGSGLAPLVQQTLDALVVLEQINAAVTGLLAAAALPVDPQLAAFNAALQALLAAVGSVLTDSANASAGLLVAAPENVNQLPLYARGLDGWRQLVSGSYYDPGDLQRPQVGASGTAGALLLVVTSPNPSELLDRIQGLLRFFNLGDRAEQLRIPAPRNFRAVPCQDDGTAVDDPLSALVPGAPSDPTALRLEWEEPSLQQQILGLYEGQLAYVETSPSRLGSVQGASVKVAADAGPSQRDRDRAAQGLSPAPEDGAVPSNPPPTAAGSPAQGGWEPLDPANTGLGGSVFGLNPTGVQKDWLAGRYYLVLKGPRYVGTDNARYYRVTIIPADVRPVLDATTGRWGLKRFVGTAPYSGSLPSAPSLGSLPDTSGLRSEDLAGAVLNVFRAAYLFRMDTSLKDAVTGNPAVAGNRTLRTPPPLSLQSSPSWEPPDPFNNAEVRTLLGAALLPGGVAPSTADALMEAGDPGVALLAAFDPFGGQEELFSPLVSEAPGTAFRRWIDRQASLQLRALAARLAQQDGFRAGWLASYRASEPAILAFLSAPVSEYGGGLWASSNNPLRTAVAGLISSLNSFSAPGTPPDWTTYRLLSDGFPLVASYLQGLTTALASLQSLGADVLASYQASLDALQARLDALTALSAALQRAVDFFAGLNQTVNILYIPPGAGGTARVAQEILTAPGAPLTGGQDYAAGIALDLSGPGLSTLLPALSLLFGL
jgi:hypothetical protein